jgi:HD-GYP domain-containing protein (c-di-GMP phosphodiesterase class II)
MPGQEFLSEVEENEKQKRTVAEAFREFGLSFEIEKHPDLHQRLVDTREHFQDAHEMARMIFAIKDKLELEPADFEKLLTATLLHDIGKSGPPHCAEGSTLRAKVKILFPHGYIPGQTHQLSKTFSK